MSAKWQLKPVGIGEIIPMKNGVLKVGRHPESDIILSYSSYCSRSHCQFEVSDTSVKVKDFNSTNGVYINRERRGGESVLQEGDRIGIGCELSDDICKKEELPIFLLKPNNGISEVNESFKQEVEMIVLDSDDDSCEESDIDMGMKKVSIVGSKLKPDLKENGIILYSQESKLDMELDGKNVLEDEPNIVLRESVKEVKTDAVSICPKLKTNSKSVNERLKSYSREAAELAKEDIPKIDMEIEVKKSSVNKRLQKYSIISDTVKKDPSGDQLDELAENSRSGIEYNPKIDELFEIERKLANVTLDSYLAANKLFNQHITSTYKPLNDEELDEILNNKNLPGPQKNKMEIYDNNIDIDHDIEMSQCLLRDIKQEFVEMESEYMDVDDRSVLHDLMCDIEPLNDQEAKSKIDIQNLYIPEEDEDIEDADESLNSWLTKLSQTPISEKKRQPPKRKIPEIIEPPVIPTKKGKLRGVAYQSSSTLKKDVVHSISKERQPTKWIENVNVRNRKEKEKRKQIQEDRKHKLKELADKDVEKRKSNDNDDDVKVVQQAKVKVTLQNRGAFLAEPFENIKGRCRQSPRKISSTNSINVQIKPIPNKKTEEVLLNKETVTRRSSLNKESSDRKTTRKSEQRTGELLLDKETITRRSSLNKESSDRKATRKSEQRTGEVLLDKERSSLNKESSDPKATRTSEQYNTVQISLDVNKENQESQKNIKSILLLRGRIGKLKKKKVRFNNKIDTKFFEIDDDAKLRKVDAKDVFVDLSPFIRESVPKKVISLVDYSENVLSEILKWRTSWINQGENEVAHDIMPMLSNFDKVEDFQRTIFPLMKLELWASIENELDRNKYISYVSASNQATFIENLGNNVGRCILECEVSLIKNKVQNAVFFVGDLCLLKIEGKLEIFVYLRSLKKRVTNTRPCIFVTLEANYSKDTFDVLKKNKNVMLKSITQIQVELGAFNAVYNLEKSVLCKYVLKPAENRQDNKSFAKAVYKGYDSLNINQQDILMKTYMQSLRLENPCISLIEGPPGTGKSRVISNLILQLLYGNETKCLGKKILVCAQSNAAIDVIATKLLSIRFKMTHKKFNLVRFGNIDKIDKAVQCISVQSFIKNRMQANQPISVIEGLQREKKMIEDQIHALSIIGPRNDVSQDEKETLKQKLDLINRSLNFQPTIEVEKKLYKSILQGAHIVCSTLSSCIRLLQYTNYFDVCVIDEATQCLEPWTLIPLQFGITSLILVGDTQQLPGTVLSTIAGQHGFNVSLFTRMQRCLEIHRINHYQIYSLRTQYRMHPDICNWPNLYFYNNKLVSDESTSAFTKIVKPYVVLNLKYDQNDEDVRTKISNSGEACFVVELILNMAELLPTQHYSYGIITPYAEQRDVISKSLLDAGIKNITVNTIDSYQGKEKDVIIISNARTRGIGFLSNSQRLNVALTRARKSLILCGNFLNLERTPVWNSLLENARQRNLYFNIEKSNKENFVKQVMCHIRN